MAEIDAAAASKLCPHRTPVAAELARDKADGYGKDQCCRPRPLRQQAVLPQCPVAAELARDEAGGYGKNQCCRPRPLRQQAVLLRYQGVPP